jgi:hypothetical protein
MRPVSAGPARSRPVSGTTPLTSLGGLITPAPGGGQFARDVRPVPGSLAQSRGKGASRAP